MRSSSLSIETRKDAAEIIDKFVRSTYDWKETDYTIEYLDGANSKNVIANVLHREDSRATQAGGGKSIRVTVDLEKKEVTQVLKYQ